MTHPDYQHPARNLTQCDVRCEALWQALRAHWREHGYGPGLRELGAAIGVASTSQVTYYLNRLREQGRAACRVLPGGQVMARSWRAIGGGLRRGDGE
jgi:SOS-response transcriptional repressor LexA